MYNTLQVYSFLVNQFDSDFYPLHTQVCITISKYAQVYFALVRIKKMFYNQEEKNMKKTIENTQVAINEVNNEMSLKRRFTYRNMTDTALAKLSAFNVWYFTAREILAKHKEDIETKKSEVETATANYINGLTATNPKKSKKEINTLLKAKEDAVLALELAEDTRKEMSKKLNKEKKDACDFVTKDLWNNYCNFMKSGFRDTYEREIIAFLESLGIATGIFRQKALADPVKRLSSAIGLKKSKEGYLAPYQFKAFQEMFVRAVLCEGICEDNAFVINADYTISRKFDDSDNNKSSENSVEDTTTK